MTNKTTNSLVTAPKRAAKKATLTAGIELADNPPLSAVEVQTHIRHRAYELFLQRSPDAGSAETDWLQAEREVMAMFSAAPAATPAPAKAPRTVRPRASSRSSPRTETATATPARTRRKQPPAAPKS